MNTNDAFKKAWLEEYNRKGIPSSFRTDPSKTVVEFISWLQNLNSSTEGTAADIGCGLGRNSFYLAAQGYTVKGIELLDENVKAINAHAQANNLPVHAYAQSAADTWPIKPHSLDIVIDIFCYKHIVNKAHQAAYRRELAKALNPDGYYFISLASEHDGFYGPLLEQSPNRQEKLIVDHYANIPSFLYSLDDLAQEFSDLFEVVHITEQKSTSPMYGTEYPRVVINAIFKKKP